MTLRALAGLAVAATAALFFTTFPGELSAQAPPALFGDSAIDVPVMAGDGPTVTRARTTSARFDLLAAALAAGSAGDRAPSSR